MLNPKHGLPHRPTVRSCMTSARLRWTSRWNWQTARPGIHG
ncbi:hypothetical protein ALP86_102220, partial [Pseudomonas amygdali pv. mori]